VVPPDGYVAEILGPAYRWPGSVQISVRKPEDAIGVTGCKVVFSLFRFWQVRPYRDGATQEDVNAQFTSPGGTADSLLHIPLAILSPSSMIGCTESGTFSTRTRKSMAVSGGQPFWTNLGAASASRAAPWRRASMSADANSSGSGRDHASALTCSHRRTTLNAALVAVLDQSVATPVPPSIRPSRLAETGCC
jgi:hypothetical protein